MELRTIKVYAFNELDPKIQAKLVASEQESLHRFFDSAMLSEWFEDQLAEAGYTACKVQWSLGYSQGDGVAWYGHVSTVGIVILAARLMPGKPFPGDIDDLDVEITDRNNHYHHWNSMAVDVNAGHGDATIAETAWIEAFERAIRNDVKVHSRELERCGYADIEYQTSEEAARTSLSENGDRYTANGNRAPEGDSDDE